MESNEEKVLEATKEFVKAFDLSKAPLLRVKVIKIEEARHILMLDMHHIISDATSMGVLVSDFVRIYNGEELKELRIQYKDFAVWQNKILESVQMKKQEEYWLERFKGEILRAEIPTDYPRTKFLNYEGRTFEIEIDRGLVKEIRKFVIERNGTLFMMLLSVYYVFLLKLTGEKDIILGVAHFGRNHVDLEKIIGMFINTLAFRNYPEFDKKFIDFFEEVKKNTIKDFENQDYPFEKLLDKIELKREQNRTPLFDVLFNYIRNTNAKDIMESSLGKLKIKPYNYEEETTKFDLTYYVFENEDEVKIRCQYRSKLFNEDTIKYYMKEYVKLLGLIVNDPEKLLEEYEILSARELLKQENIMDKEGFDEIKRRFKSE
jgi:hypothetical protein